jgi:hypothetical protein
LLCLWAYGQEAFLGPLPDEWCVEVAVIAPIIGKTGVNTFFYVNTEKGLRTKDDSRVWELPVNWESYLDVDGLLRFRNTRTFEDSWSDPRLASVELQKHGDEIHRHSIIILRPKEITKLISCDYNLDFT